ncbi:MAG: hypothetical protein ABI647_02485 [Gemmatimonadota bacterium]
MPKITVFELGAKRSGGGPAPGGVGEPGTPSIAPAVASAGLALAGKRIRKLPIRLA